MRYFYKESINTAGKAAGSSDGQLQTHCGQQKLASNISQQSRYRYCFCCCCCFCGRDRAAKRGGWIDGWMDGCFFGVSLLLRPPEQTTKCQARVALLRKKMKRARTTKALLYSPSEPLSIVRILYSNTPNHPSPTRKGIPPGCRAYPGE